METFQLIQNAFYCKFYVAETFESSTFHSDPELFYFPPKCWYFPRPRKFQVSNNSSYNVWIMPHGVGVFFKLSHISISFSPFCLHFGLYIINSVSITRSDETCWKWPKRIQMHGGSYVFYHIIPEFSIISNGGTVLRRSNSTVNIWGRGGWWTF